MWITETSEGPIMAALYKGRDGKEYKFVVKTTTTKDYRQTTVPKRDDRGRLIYAVPGGGEYIEGVGLL